MRGSLKILAASTVCVLVVLAFTWGIGGAAASTLAPALIALTGAFATRRPALSLAIGAFVGAALASRADWLSAPGRFAGYWTEAIGDSDHLRIIGFTLCLGVVARAASQRLTGALKFSALESMRPAPNSRRLGRRFSWTLSSTGRVQLVVWAWGLLLFIDDYLNAMLVGATSRPLFDRVRLSREKLAFLVDATSAPVTSLVPMSTWIAVELGYIADHSPRAAQEGALAVFVGSLPFRFYPLMMLVFALATILLGREFGPMRRAVPVDVAAGDAAPAPGAAAMARSGSRAWVEAALPILAVLGIAGATLFITAWQSVAQRNQNWATALGEVDTLEALLYGAVAAALLALGLEWVSSGRVRTRALLVEGVRSMLGPSAILIGAWMLSACLGELRTAEQLAAMFSVAGHGAWLSALVFLAAAVTSFATGTSWGTMAILFPLALPFVPQTPGTPPELELSVVGALLAGAVFGDHCSPISDTTIISAAASGCDTMQHVITQLPYAITVGLVALVQHASVTLLPPGWALLLGSCVLLAIVRWVGRPSQTLSV